MPQNRQQITEKARTGAGALLLLASLIPPAAEAAGLPDFTGAGERHGVDPCLLIAVSLKESGRVLGDGTAVPSELAIRAGGKSYFPRSRREAERILREVRRHVPERDIDAGMMQLNLYWQKGRSRDPALFLRAETALDAAAEILRETALSTDDPELQAGRYHSFTESLARPYGREVLRIRDGIRRLPGYDGICAGGRAESRKYRNIKSKGTDGKRGSRKIRVSGNEMAAGTAANGRGPQGGSGERRENAPRRTGLRTYTGRCPAEE